MWNRFGSNCGFQRLEKRIQRPRVSNEGALQNRLQPLQGGSSSRPRQFCSALDRKKIFPEILSGSNADGLDPERDRQL